MLGRALLRFPGRPGRPRRLVALGLSLATAVIAAVVAAGLPTRFELREQRIGAHTSRIVPVNTVGTAADDFAILSSTGRLVLGRPVEGEVLAVWELGLASDAGTPIGLDLNGDGDEEVLVPTRDSTAAAIVAFDHARREVVRFGPLDDPAGAGGTWLHPAAVLPAGGRRALGCLVLSPRAAGRRGVVVFDAASGRPLWDFPTGSYPAQLAARDLDGDGAEEWLLATSSPDNGAEANGTRDDATYTAALDAAGRLRWLRRTGGAFAASALCVIERGGRPVVVVAVRSHRGAAPEPGAVLAFDAASGALLLERRFPGGPMPPVPFHDGAPRVALGDRDGTLRVFDADLNVVASRRLDAPVRVWEACDLDADGTVELLASTTTSVLVLSPALVTLGAHPLPEPAHGPVRILAARDGTRRWRLVIDDGRGVIAAAMAVPWWRDAARGGAVAGAVAAAALLGLCAPLPQRRPRSAAEVREFLVDYHQVHHESFDDRRPFARLRLWAQGAAAGLAQSSELLDAAATEFLAIGLPTLRRFVERARAAGVAPDRIARLAERCASIERALEALRSAGEGARRDALGRALAHADAIHEEARAAYREVALRRPCVPAAELRRALDAKLAGPAFQRARLRIELDPAGLRPVLFDAPALRAVIAELIENAGRALDRTEDPCFTARVAGDRRDARWVVIEIEDNGPGIAPGQIEDLFRPDVSTRPEGGFGLGHARDTARAWLGDVTLGPGAEGRGTVAALRLRAVDHAGGAVGTRAASAGGDA
uniref:histidine kinase n=1 Tax=Eiseniibacteriota bacterium TaxID=2212470 RepID=A0A832I0Y2_UNCEI